MEKVQINEIGLPRVSAGWAGDGAEEGGVLMGEGKVSEDVLFIRSVGESRESSRTETTFSKALIMYSNAAPMSSSLEPK